jgi:hypothetical protein
MQVKQLIGFMADLVVRFRAVYSHGATKGRRRFISGAASA